MKNKSNRAFGENPYVSSHLRPARVRVKLGRYHYWLSLGVWLLLFLALIVTAILLGNLTLGNGQVQISWTGHTNLNSGIDSTTSIYTVSLSYPMACGAVLALLMLLQALVIGFATVTR